MGIGEWHVRSALGERAEADAEIYHDAGDLIELSCFQLLYPGSGADFPAIEEGKLALLSTPKGLRLKLTSGRLVNEPIIQVRLKIGCGASQTRDMVLLFSPKELPPAPVQVAEAETPPEPQKPAQAAVHPDAAAPAASAATKAAPVAHMRSPAAPTPRTTKPVTGAPGANAVKPRLAAATQLRPVAKSGKLVLSGEIDPEIANRLRLSAAMRNQPTQSTQATQEEREQLRRLYQTMMQLADLKEGLASGKAKQPPAVPAATPAPAPVAPLPATQPQPTPPVAPPQAAPKATPVPPPVKPDEAKATPLPPLDSLSNWWMPALGVLLLALLLGLALWLARRRRGQRELPEPIEPMPPIHKLDIHSRPGGQDEETLDALLKKEEAMPEASALPAKPATASPFASPTSGGMTIHSENTSFQTSYRTMLDLAESMMAFGLTNDAADALKEYVEDHPDVAVEPWIKLLDILRQTGTRHEFEQYGQKLKHHFNIDLPGWETADAAAIDSNQNIDLIDRKSVV
jgi:hypothetical protein